MKLSDMFIILFFVSFLNSTEYKSILWITKSTSDISEICEYKKNNDFNITILTSNDISTDNINGVEFIDNFIDFYPVGDIFLNSNSPTSLNFLSYLFDYYYNTKAKNKKGLFFSGSVNKTVASLLKSYGYEWVVSGSSNNMNNVVGYNGLNVVYFQTLNSTATISQSTWSFFVVNDIYGQSSVDILKDIFSNKDLKFLTVSENIKNYISTTTEQEFLFYPVVDYLSFFSCDKYKGYVNYLSNINEDLLKNNVNIDTKFFDIYYQFFDFFKNICDVDLIEEIRDLTKNIYRTKMISIPYFVYYDFLSSKNDEIYNVNKSSVSVTYSAISTAIVNSFSITKNGGFLEFSINLSTQPQEIHIYIDINKRRKAGVSQVIDKLEVFDDSYGWEYAFVIKGDIVYSYKAGFMEYEGFKKYHITKKDNKLFFKVDSSDFYGNFTNWSYFVLNYNDKKLIDGIYKLVDLKFLYPVE